MEKNRQTQMVKNWMDSTLAPITATSEVSRADTAPGDTTVVMILK